MIQLMAILGVLAAFARGVVSFFRPTRQPRTVAVLVATDDDGTRELALPAPDGAGALAKAVYAADDGTVWVVGELRRGRRADGVLWRVDGGRASIAAVLPKKTLDGVTCVDGDVVVRSGRTSFSVRGGRVTRASGRPEVASGPAYTREGTIWRVVDRQPGLGAVPVAEAVPAPA